MYFCVTKGSTLVFHLGWTSDVVCADANAVVGSQVLAEHRENGQDVKEQIQTHNLQA